MGTRTGLRLGDHSGGYCVDADGALAQRSNIAERSLDSLLADGPLEPEKALWILRSAALTLDSVRWSGRGFHGRLRPDVIAIDEVGDAVFVKGFGEGDGPVGSPDSSRAGEYMASEVLSGAPLEASTDTYALGCILYEALTGERPRASPRRSGGRSAPLSPRSLRPGLPRSLDAVIGTALAEKPEGRYSTCVDLLTAAEAAFGAADDRGPAENDASGTSSRTCPEGGLAHGLLVDQDRPAVGEPNGSGGGTARGRRLLTVAIVLAVVGFLGALVALDSGRSNETANASAGSPDVREEPLTRVFGDEGASEVASSSARDTLDTSSARANSVIRIDGRTGRIYRAIPVGTGLVAIEAGDEALWALSAGDGTIAKIDAVSDEVLETISVEGVPAAGAAVPGLDGVWVVNARNGQIIEVNKRDFGAGHSQSVFAVGSPPTLLTAGPTSLTLGQDAAWIAIPAGSGNSTRLVRISLSSKQPTAIAEGGRRPSQLALGGGSLWLGDREGAVRRLDPTTLQTLAEVNVGGVVAGMVWTDDALWVSACDAAGGLIAVVDSTTDTLVRRSRVRGCSFGIDAGFGSIWLASPSHGRVLELDPSNGSVLSLIRVNGRPVDLAVSERGVYVALGS